MGKIKNGNTARQKTSTQISNKQSVHRACISCSLGWAIPKF